MAQTTDAQATQTPSAPTVEIDTEQSDSVYGDELSSYSASLTSSVQNYEWKHGRRYHSYQSGSYQFPNDEAEQDRLDMCHHIFFKTLSDQLFLAPINPSGMRILDLGTGTGDLYPSAELIIGNDLSPIQPQWVPPNVKFVVDDIEQQWTEPQPYDYIHCRYLCGSIHNWPKLVRQCYENLKPGGWVEFQEPFLVVYSEDDTLKPDSSFVKMVNLLAEACDKISRPLNIATSIKGLIEDAGFESVEEKSLKMPVGTWPKDARLKEIGAFNAINIIEGVEAFTAALFADVLGWSEEEIAVLNAGVRRDVKTKDNHSIYDFVVVTARKPE
ncbi:hypothetical protein VTN02DRAFT_3326 [Thermoascus thermophilus]